MIGLVIQFQGKTIYISKYLKKEKSEDIKFYEFVSLFWHFMNQTRSCLIEKTTSRFTDNENDVWIKSVLRWKKETLEY